MSLLNDERLQAYVAATAHKFNVPGISISLVDLSRNDVSSKGFSFAPGETVTKDTVFQICSNTKLFTAVAYGILVDEGKCKWDSKLCDLLPGLKLQDEHAQQTLTVEDMLSHQSGLVGDLLLSNAVEAINGLRFALPPRKQYRYCNIAVHLVGQVVASISGMLFEDFVKLRILEPLDMEDTTWSFPKAGRGLVQGYVTTWKDDKLRQKIDLPAIGLPRDSLSAAGGGMLSTAGDMSKWLAFLLRLAKGVASDEDKAILRPETLRELLRSRVIASQQIGALSVPAGESLWEEMSVPTYALAQLCGSYRGIAFASHNGTGLGGGTVLLWTPKGNFGICVLTNVLGSVFHAGISIALCALDLHLERPTLNWNERLALQPLAQDDTMPTLPRKDTDSAQLSELRVSGRYHASTYGRMHILELNCISSSLDDRLSEIVTKYESSQPFGKVLEVKPTLLAVFPETSAWHIYELYYVHKDVFFGVPIDLVEDAKGGVRRVSIWTIMSPYTQRFEFFPGADSVKASQLEFYNAWTDDPAITGLGRGTATFTKTD